MFPFPKDFGSFEGCVNDEEIFFRGKQTVAHEYKHFENSSAYVWVEGVEGRNVSGVLKQ